MNSVARGAILGCLGLVLLVGTGCDFLLRFVSPATREGVPSSIRSVDDDQDALRDREKVRERARIWWILPPPRR
jgi:hypothetical protein